MGVARFDHVAIPAADPESLLAFYRSLGFLILYEQEWRAGNGVPAIAVGPDQKITCTRPRCGRAAHVARPNRAARQRRSLLRVGRQRP